MQPIDYQLHYAEVAGLFHDPGWGVIQKKKPPQREALLWVFVFAE